MVHRNIHTKVKTAKGRKLSSSLWLKRQLNDQYVAMAQKEGYRSRAAYKLLEIDKKFNVFSKNKIILDLGAAPGSWSQVVKLYSPAKVIAVDLLEIQPIKEVEIIQGDFTDFKTIHLITELIDNKKIDILISDMSPNLSGHKNTDHVRIIALCEAVFNFAKEMLAPNGVMIMKIFQGGTEKELLKEIKKYFRQVYHFKPESSRKESSEMYLIAKDFLYNSNIDNHSS